MLLKKHESSNTWIKTEQTDLWTGKILPQDTTVATEQIQKKV